METESKWQCQLQGCKHTIRSKEPQSPKGRPLRYCSEECRIKAKQKKDRERKKKKHRLKDLERFLEELSLKDLDELRRRFRTARKGYWRSRNQLPDTLLRYDSFDPKPDTIRPTYLPSDYDDNEKRLFSKAEVRKIVDDAFDDFFQTLKKRY